MQHLIQTRTEGDTGDRTRHTYEHVHELSCGKLFLHVCQDFWVVHQCREMLTGAIMNDY